MGRGEDLHHQTIIADGALIERALDLVVGIGLASGEGLGEIRVLAAPAIDRGGFDIEEIGDIRFGQAVATELAGLIGMDGPVAVGARIGPGVWRDARGIVCGLRSGGRFPLFLRRNREFSFFFGRSKWAIDAIAE